MDIKRLKKWAYLRNNESEVNIMDKSRFYSFDRRWQKLVKEIDQIEKDNERAMEEGKKILKFLPKESYDYFFHDEYEKNTHTDVWKKQVQKDYCAIIKQISKGTINLIRYVVTKNGDLYIEVKSGWSLVYLPSHIKLRKAGACWSERVWFDCFKGQQEFIRDILFLNNMLTFDRLEVKEKEAGLRAVNRPTPERRICLDMTRMNLLYYPYIKHQIQVFEKPIDYTKLEIGDRDGIFITKPNTVLEEIQEQYLDIMSWVENEPDNDDFVKLYNKDNGKLLLTVLGMIDLVDNIKHKFEDKQHSIVKGSFLDLQGYYGYDLSVLDKEPDDFKKWWFKESFHSQEEAYDKFEAIYANYYKHMNPIIHNLPLYERKRLFRISHKLMWL